MEIKLNIRNEYLYMYLGYIFRKTPDDKFIVSRATDLGRICCAYVKYTDTPCLLPDAEFTATLILPKSCNIPDRAERFYTHFDSFDTDRINDAIYAESNYDFRAFYHTGRTLGYRQKEIISAYIQTRGLHTDTGPDTLKKKAYRFELEKQKKLSIALVNKAKYITKQVENNIVQDLTACKSMK